jgi:hypothetical protein
MAAKPGTRTEAKVTNGALVVSFTGEGLPKVWRAEIGHLSSTAFELKDAQDKTALVMKTPQNTEEVFAFSDKASAAAGLQAITQALFSDTHAGGSAPARKSGFFGKLFKTLFFSALALICVAVLVTVSKTKPLDLGAGVAPSAVKTGVPVPADEMFGK